jgi:cysteine synthase
MIDRKGNVFEGPTAVKDFLHPENSPPLPLVELPDALNPFRDKGVRIFAKLMYLLPMLNIKSLPALNMLLEAQSSGRLDGVSTIIENSSGNTAFALGVLCRLFGIQQVTALVPWDIAPGKLDMLRLVGAEPRLHKDAADSQSGIELARVAGKQKGHFNPGQYNNDANPAAFEKWLAPELWNQSNGKMTVMVAGLGTTGTFVGMSRYFRRNSLDVTMVGVICRADSAVPGVRSEARLREIGFSWREASDTIVEIGTKESFKWSLQLCRWGLMAGPSSGFALAGLQHFLETQVGNSALDRLRNKDGEVYTTFICGDTPFPYLDKYSTHLDPSDF